MNVFFVEGGRVVNLSFVVTLTPEGAYGARCLEAPIQAEGDTWGDLRIMVSAAVARRFDFPTDCEITYVVGSEVSRVLLRLTRPERPEAGP